jgi:hypothetical protein
MGAGFAGEAAEEGLAGWGFDEVVDNEREQNEDSVGEPGVEGGQMETLGDAVDVE